MNKNIIISNIEYDSIVTIGMFDGVHMGHQHLLKQLLHMAEIENLVPVVVTFDQHPRVVLRHTDDQFRLISTLEERKEGISRCGVSLINVIPFTPEEARLSACQFVETHLLGRLNMKALVLGYDNQFGNKACNDFDQLPMMAEQHGFKIFHDTPLMMNGIEVSSTQVRKALLGGNVTLAGQMLGKPYAIEGRVVHGRSVGRTIGFPTANIALNDPMKALPRNGVYGVRVTFPNGRQSLGMTNIGPQPTFDSGVETIEVNIFEFQDDCYGATLKVEFLQHLRQIVRFGSSEELVEQLKRDKERVIQLNNGI